MPADIAALAGALRASVRGPVCLPGDPDFAAEIVANNLATIHTPDLAVGVTSVDDVVAVIRAARDQGARVHVQSTGHGADHAIKGGVLVATRRLDAVHVDAGSQVATIGAGVRWAPVVAAAAEHGLAAITGSSPSVGCVGYLAGGGVGPLARSHGFSSDYVVGLTMVTGTGEVVNASVDEHPDLLWAYRGGKTLMGIVTEVRVRLVGLRTVYGGALMFAEADMEAALRAWVAWKDGAPDDVTTSIALLHFPPIELLPPPLRGRRLLSIRFAYPGDAVDGEQLAAPLRAAAPVYLDTVGVLPTTEMGRIHSDPSSPVPNWLLGMLLDRVDQAFATELLARFGAGTDSAFMVVEVRHVGCATKRDVPEGSAVSGRTVEHTLMCIAADPGRFGRAASEAAALSQAIRPWMSHDRNPNFPDQSDIVTCLADDAPTARSVRLAEVRRRYDPDGVFG